MELGHQKNAGEAPHDVSEADLPRKFNDRESLLLTDASYARRYVLEGRTRTNANTQRRGSRLRDFTSESREHGAVTT